MPLTAADALGLLRKANSRNRLAHSYLITGPSGSGKRDLALKLCGVIVGDEIEPARHADVHAIEPESRSRRIVIDQIRALEHGLHMRSANGTRKAGVIFDADRLQPQAANAFLKTLEEPPAQAHLILVSSLPDQLLETILSRCIQIPLHRTERVPLSPRQEELLAVLKRNATRERLDLPGVFDLARDFQKLLAAAKESAQEEGEAEFKAESQRYKQIADPKWFEEREDHYKALTEARYSVERGCLLEVLETWWGDILRQQTLSQAAGEIPSLKLDYPECSSETALAASRCTQADALARTASLEDLRDLLGRSGIQEQLAIEVAFLKAFGSHGE